MSGKSTTTEAQAASGAVSSYLAAIGRKGGASGTGKSKARSKSQARKAALARWSKRVARRANAQGEAQPPATKL